MRDLIQKLHIAYKKRTVIALKWFAQRAAELLAEASALMKRSFYCVCWGLLIYVAVLLHSKHKYLSALTIEEKGSGLEFIKQLKKNLCLDQALDIMSQAG